jgi:uncharacterized protein YdeI (YjbR/CyaY-like superfamily)
VIPTDRFAMVEVRSARDLWDWLAAHHGQAESVWLVTWKKAAGVPYVSREEVLDALVAHGWTDGIRRVLDEARTMQLVSPRRQQVWALSYRERVARLRREGRMRPPGEAAVAAAMRAGLWEADAAVDALVVPGALAEALAARGARAAFDAAAPSYRRNVLRWIARAKTAPTREKRIAAVAEAAAEGRRVPQM